MGLIYFDGQYVPEEEAKVSVFDHGLLYGDGLFEGIRAYNGRVFKLAEHINRLFEGARTIMLNIPLSPEELTEIVLETCRRNKLTDAYIRLVVTRGRGDLGLDPRKCKNPSIICIAMSMQYYAVELYEKGLEIATVATRRNVTEAVNPMVKSLNYLNNIMAKIEVNRMNLPEGLLLNQEGYVAEATGDNIFIVKGGILITPPPHVGILKGITRNTVMDLARDSGIPVEEQVFTRHEVYTADEVFLTGTAAEVIPVVIVDGRIIGNGVPGQMTRDLIHKFKELTLVDGPAI